MDINNDFTSALLAANHPTMVAEPKPDEESILYENHPQDSRVKESKGVCQALTSRMGTGGGNVPLTNGKDFIVRRITPTEAERLQGFPDEWTNIPYKGKDYAPDAPRYKALGNSMAVPVMKWIAQRIDYSMAHPITENTAEPVDWQPSLFF